MILLVTNLLLMTILITLNKGITGLIITEKHKCNVAFTYVIITSIISKVIISIVIVF